MTSSCNGVVSQWQWSRQPKQKKKKQKKKKKRRKQNNRMKTKTKGMKLNWSLGENWTHDHNSRTPPPLPPQKKFFLDCENAIKNLVMINYSWQENEKFAREMLHLFTCTAKNRIHFVADFITVYTKSAGLHVPGNNPLTFTEFYIVSTALTNVPFGIWKRTTFQCPDQDIFLRTTICKFPLQCFWLTAQIYFRSPLPPPPPPPHLKKQQQKIKLINK